MLTACCNICVKHLLQQNVDAAVISGTTRQIRLYTRMGFTPFGPLVGNTGALYQPMYITLRNLRHDFKTINVSTGPVGITRQVQKALQEPPLSHRSIAFRNLYDQTTAFLSYSFHVRETYLLTGSGTLANEVMLQEIKCTEGKGLILSNGEFGNRLIARPIVMG